MTPATRKRIEAARTAWDQAAAKDRHGDAAKALAELEELEPTEALWSHRLGEAYRRLKRPKEAEDAFARAALRYHARGHFPRAAAMARLVLSLDPSRAEAMSPLLSGPEDPPPARSAPPAPRVISPSVAPAAFTVPAPPPEPAVTGDGPRAYAVGPAEDPVSIVIDLGELEAAVAEARASTSAAPSALPAPFGVVGDLLEDPSRVLEVPSILAGPVAPSSPPSPAPFGVLPATPSAPPSLPPFGFVPDFGDDPSRIVEVPIVPPPPAPPAAGDFGAIDDDAFLPEPSVVIEVPEALGRPRLDPNGVLRASRVFAALTADACRAFADASEVVAYDEGAVLPAGAAADALFVVASGRAALVAPGAPPSSVVEGEIFGEECLLEEARLAAGVVAATRLEVLRIPKACVDRLLVDHPEAASVLFELLARRLVLRTLHASPLFAPFGPRVRLEVAGSFALRRALAGTVLGVKGRWSDGMYLLLSGGVSLRDALGNVFAVAPGQAFGHGSLFSMAPPAHVVLVEREAILLRLPVMGLVALSQSHPDVAAHLRAIADVRRAVV